MSNLLFAIERYTDLICKAEIQGAICKWLLKRTDADWTEAAIRAARKAWHYALEAERVRM